MSDMRNRPEAVIREGQRDLALNRFPVTLLVHGFFGWQPVGRYASIPAARAAAKRRGLVVVTEKRS